MAATVATTRVGSRHVVLLLDHGRGTSISHSGYVEQPVTGKTAVLVQEDGRRKTVRLDQIRRIEDANGVEGEW